MHQKNVELLPDRHPSCRKRIRHLTLTIISTTEDNEADQIASALEEKPDGIIVSLLSDQTASISGSFFVPTVLLGTRGSLKPVQRLSQISLSAKAAGVSLAQLLLSTASSASDLKIEFSVPETAPLSSRSGWQVR